MAQQRPHGFGVQHKQFGRRRGGNWHTRQHSLIWWSWDHRRWLLWPSYCSRQFGQSNLRRVSGLGHQQASTGESRPIDRLESDLILHGGTIFSPERHLYLRRMAERRGQRVILARNLLGTLRNLNLAQTAKDIAAETGLAHRPVTDGQRVAGIYRRSINAHQRALRDAGRRQGIQPGVVAACDRTAPGAVARRHRARRWGVVGDRATAWAIYWLARCALSTPTISTEALHRGSIVRSNR